MSATLGTPAETDRSPLPPTPIGFEAFLAWALAEEGRYEWVDGEVVPMSPQNVRHLDLIGFLYRLLVTYVEAHDLGRVFLAGLLMRLPTRPSGREPDLLFVATEHLDRLHETYLDGPADLVVEIVSPESDARDHGEKLVEYEAAGIPEYWLVDPLRRDALFHVLGEDGRYRRVSPDADDWYTSQVLPGFRIQVGRLWQRPLPPIGEVVAQTVV